MQLRFFDIHSRLKQLTLIDYLLICFSFSLALSTALSSILFILTLLSIPFKEDYFKDLKQTLRLPIVKLLICFVIWMIIGLAYNPAPLKAVGHPLKQAIKPLGIFFMIPLITPNNQSLIIKAFIYSMLLTAILAIIQHLPGLYFELKPHHDYGPGSIFKNRITTSFFSAFASFFMAHITFDNSAYKGRNYLFNILILSALTLHVLFLNAGRTGFIIFFVLFTLFLFQKYQWKKRIIGFGILIILSTVSFHFSSQIKERAMQVKEQYAAYSMGKSDTSVGLRLEFAQNSFNLLKQKPIIGWGTGSFPEAYKTLPVDKKIVESTNPHNQYALIAVENGVIGLFLFCLFLAYSLWISFFLNKEVSCIFQGIIIAFGVGSLGNSLLLDHAESFLFTLFTALALSNLIPSRKEKSV